MNLLIELIAIVLHVITFAIFARAILSWFPQGQENPVAKVLFQVTEPVIAPFRRIIPRFGMIDLAPLVALIVLQVVANILQAGVSN